MPDHYRVIVSPQAFDDLNGILEYIAQQSSANAAAVIDRLLNDIFSLELFPGRNSIDEGSRDLPFEVRSMPVPPFRVIYRIFKDKRLVRVLTVEHGARERHP